MSASCSQPAALPLGEPSLLVPGSNCWRVERARRAALLVDGAAYFSAVAAAIERARHSLLLVGWDLHSRIALCREGPASGKPFADLLDAAVRRRPGLHVHLLAWDYAMLYTLERELLPSLRFGAQTHRRVHFALDGQHPPTASHHQKLVVVDDALAFCGGLDLTAGRWDTREHRPDDPRRDDPGSGAYAPFHDVQVAVDGAAAAALGQLVRERWRHGTGKRLRPPPPGSDAWPARLAPDLRDVAVGIARTEPAYDERPEVREVEQLYVDAIGAARRSIYLENQYLTSQRVGEALERRLRERRGPEVLIVGPKTCSGWLEQGTMGVLRSRLVARLQAADAHGRLAVCHPVLPGERALMVHAKVLVVDDRLLRVGSANLSNRSMGLDTECDVAIEARDAAQSAAIRRLRDGLVAEHLGATLEQVQSAAGEQGSLRRVLERLNGGARRLAPLQLEAHEWLDDLLPEELPVDPERPLDLDAFLHWSGRAGEDAGVGRRPVLAALGLGLLLVAVLVAAWHFTALGEWASAHRLAAAAEPLRSSAWGPLLGWGAFTVAGLLMLPVVILIVASGLVFGWALGSLTALAGCLAVAMGGYGLGSLLWKDAVRQLAGRRLNRISRAFARGGVLAVAALRVVPVAPFGVVNMVAGASHVGFRDYTLGTLLGMTPGVLAICIATDRAMRAALEPDLANIALGVAALGLGAAAVVGYRRWLRSRSAR